MVAVRNKKTGKFLHRKYRSSHRRGFYAGYYAKKKGITQDEEAYSADINNAATYANEAAVKLSFHGCGWKAIHNPDGTWSRVKVYDFPPDLEIVELLAYVGGKYE